MRPPFDPHKMLRKYGNGPTYATSSSPVLAARFSPSLYFYVCLLAGPFGWLARKAAKNQCDDVAWVYGSAWLGDILENSGCKIHIDGMENLDSQQPRIYVANHMSTLETFLLPALLRIHGKVTFVVKRSLVEMPFFGPIMRSRNPIVVDRENPRRDLQVMLGDGQERLKDGYSIIVFPQSTRSSIFSREHFNSIGVKMAARANVPVTPIALKTDAWGAGGKIKELGKIRPDLPVRIRIGKTMSIRGNGKAEHNEICAFIEDNLSQWQKSDGINQ